MNFAITRSSWTVFQEKVRVLGETIEADTRLSAIAKDRLELSKSSLLSQLTAPILGSYLVILNCSRRRGDTHKFSTTAATCRNAKPVDGTSTVRQF
jgi:hypothetical protein